MNDAPTPLAEEGLWTRLRRRKLVQWTVAYVAGAWGVLQGIAYMRETFGWPAYVQQSATLALLIGLPIVTVLAWYHGDRGQQQVSRGEFVILTGLFLLGGGLFWYFNRASETATTTTASSEPHANGELATDASIAVLPFVNMSSDKEQEYFADGISEELLNLLAKVPELRVIARTSSFSFKGKDVPIAEIARTLSVANVLEGSVRKSGEKLRITAQLIRAADSSRLWSQTYDREMNDVFAVQDEIAKAVVKELKIKLLTSVSTLEATDPTAYAVFLKARQVARRGTAAGFEQSIALYQDALAIAPDYAPAWVELAVSYVAQVGTYLRPADEGMRLARSAVDKALAADPNYGPAHGLAAWIADSYERDLAAAVRHIEHALALDPTNPDLISIAASLARRLGRLEEAITLAEYVMARDPISTQGGYDLATAYFYAGRLDDATAGYRADLELFPDTMGDHEMIGEVLLLKGDAKAALAEIEKEPSESIRLNGLAMAYHALGRKADSDAALAELIKKYEETMSWGIALAYAFRGDADLAFEWLEKAVEYNDPTVGSTAAYPLMTRLHSDPRWLPFLREHGMAPDQLAAISFNVEVPRHP